MEPDPVSTGEGKSTATHCRAISIALFSCVATPEVNNLFSGMELILNQETHSFPDHCTIQQLMDIVLPDKQKGIAVAINQTVIPKPHWDTYTLHSNDNILIIKATQGG